MGSLVRAFMSKCVGAHYQELNVKNDPSVGYQFGSVPRLIGFRFVCLIFFARFVCYIAMLYFISIHALKSLARLIQVLLSAFLVRLIECESLLLGDTALRVYFCDLCNLILGKPPHSGPGY